MDHLKEGIEYYSENIAKAICDMPSINLKDLNQLIKTRMIFAFNDLLSKQLHNLEEYRSSLLIELNADIPSWRRAEINNELAKIKTDRKQLNKAISDCKNYSEYQLLISYCHTKLGDNFMKEFFETLNRK